MSKLIGLCGVIAACSKTPSPPPAPTPVPTVNAAADAAPDAKSPYARSVIALPGGGADGVGMDYLLFDPRTNTVWVPAGNTAAVDVIDTKTHVLAQVLGFATKEIERNGKKRMVGPSSATLGDVGTVYVGNRGDQSVCAIDETKLLKGACGTLDAMPDGIAYVAPTHEVWVTTPGDKSLRILDGKTLAQKSKITLESEPEGFAVDATRGWFYTNLEDKDETVAISLKTHAVVATWHPKCGENGPHGLRLSEADGRLLVACSAEVHALDVTKDGAMLGTIAVGDGLDDLDLDSANHTVYAGGGKAGSLSVVTIQPNGSLVLLSRAQTAEGARNSVVATNGEVYLSHSKGSEIVVLTPAKK
jgi:DNA-binding beta-propeller fold protein YncE